jgi:hypothetical protein
MTQTKAELLQTKHQGDLKLGDADSSHYVGFKAPATVGSNLVWTLPATDGSANQFLQTNASGVLGWGTADVSSAMPLTGGTFTGDVTFDGATAGRDIVFDRSDNALEFADNAYLWIGSGNDIELWHDGTNSNIKSNTGQLKIRGSDIRIKSGDDGETMAVFSDDGACEFNFNNIKKFETTATGIAVTGAATISTNLTVTGDLTVSGTTTTINTQTLDVEDKNVVIGKVSSPSDTTADGGGWTLKGATDKTFNWVNATDAWTSSEHIHFPDNKKIYLGGASGTFDGVEMYHDGNNSYIKDMGTGELFIDGGAVNLKFGGNTKLTTTSGGINVTGAINVNGSALSTAPTITATASGAITIGKAVKINSDGTVSVITGQSKSLGSLQTLTTENATAMGCYDSTNNRIFVCYKGDSDIHYSQIGTISGSTITWGTRVSHGVSGGGSMFKSPPHYNAGKDRFITCTSEGSNRTGYIRNWSASGTTLTLQSSTTFPENGIECPSMINVTGTVRYGFFYKRQNNSNYLAGFVGYLSSDGNSFSRGGLANLTTQSCEPADGCWVTDKSFFFVPYTNHTHGGRMEARLVLDPGGTSGMSSGTLYEVNPHNQTNQRGTSAVCIGGSQVVLNVYRTDNQSGFLAIWKPTSATNMGTQGTNYTLPDSMQSGNLVHADLYDTSDGAMLYHIFQYGNSSSNDYVRLNKFRIGADNSMTLVNDASDNSAENILESQGYNGFGTWHAGQKAIIAFTRDGDLHYQVALRNASDIQDTGVAGFSSAGYSNGATATINVVGNTVTQSGLTVGKEYFVTNTGDVSLTASLLKSVKAGVAISATSLLIQT